LRWGGGGRSERLSEGFERGVEPPQERLRRGLKGAGVEVFVASRAADGGFEHADGGRAGGEGDVGSGASFGRVGTRRLLSLESRVAVSGL
jgi:hypothetical protein